MVTILADVSREESASKAVDEALNTFGKLDILVNNAGRIIYKPLVEMTLDEWNWQMQTNSTGAFLHTREALKAMTRISSGRSSILPLTLPITLFPAFLVTLPPKVFPHGDFLHHCRVYAGVAACGGLANAIEVTCGGPTRPRTAPGQRDKG